MKIKKSFTLSEIMIALAVLGIIVAACVPIILNMAPNKNAIMIKKAYYTTQQIVSDLINDENYFPDGDLSNEADVKVAGTGIETAQARKFRCLFASKLNIDAKSSPLGSQALSGLCTAHGNLGEGNLIYTNDGMIWNFVHCPISSNRTKWDNGDGCRIDISTSHDIIHTGYDADSPCQQDGNGWGADVCGVKLVHKIGKMAIFIDKNGNISLNGKDMMNQPNDQEHIRDIINGSISLMGK